MKDTRNWLTVLWSAAALTAAGCGGGGYGDSTSSPTPVAMNAAPSVGGVPDQAVDEDSLTDPIKVVVSDAETSAEDLDVSVSAADGELLPPDGIDLAGAGGERTLTLVPAPGRSGSTDVTVTVTDGGGASASSSFRLVVNALFRTEFASWMRDTVLARNALDVPVGASHEDGSPLSDVENVVRIKFSDATSDDPTAYDDLLPSG